MNEPSEMPSHMQSSASSGVEWTLPASAVAAVGPGSGVKNLSIVKQPLAAGLYIATLLWAYAAIVSPKFAYQGYTLRWPSALEMVWLVAVALLPSLLLPYALSRPSALILWYLYLAAYVPSILVPALSLSMPFEELLPFQVFLLLCMGLLCLSSFGRLLAIDRIHVSRTWFWTGFLVVWGTSIGFLCIVARTSVLVGNIASLFNGATEYTIRTDFRNLVLEAGPVVAYTVGQLANALDPFLIAFGLAYRRKVCLIAGVIGQIVVFSLTGAKAPVFCPLFLALVAVLVRRWRRSFGLALTLGLVLIILLCAGVDHATGRVICSSLITRRSLMGPGLVTGFYFEYYSHESPVGFGFHFSHDENFVGPPNAIGLAYFGTADLDANGNMWAEGFAEFGLPGILAFTILVAFMLWIYDSITARCDPLMAVLLAAAPAILLGNTSPLTVLITHGGVAVGVLIYLWPPPERGEAPGPEISPEKNRLMFAATESL